MDANSQVDRRERARPAIRGRKLPTAQLAGLLLRTLILCSVPVLLLLGTACASTTVLQANFNADTLGSPPAPAQGVGTVSVDPGGGAVTVVAAPAPALPANKWVQISHPIAPSPQTGMRGDFAQFFGAGNYSLLASLYIPSGTGAVTVAFEPIGFPESSYTNFMHLDFMPEGDVRVDDGPVRFGHFPRDQPFALAVGLNITATTATAHISLFGTGASGTQDVNVSPILLPLAPRFDAVRFWMGFQWQGSFFVDDVIVTRQNP